MTEQQQSGLRFDIYERVHVSESQAGIQELDEIELVPHIRVHVEEDQAVVQGNLWLTGKYAGEQGGDPQTLEHLIPVEITMPLVRIQKLEEVQVDIENFDVDLLSARSLNVTGVLSLRGIEMRSDDADESPVFAEEEFVLVHEAGSAGNRGEEARIFPEEVGLPGTESTQTAPVADSEEAEAATAPVEAGEIGEPPVAEPAAEGVAEDTGMTQEEQALPVQAAPAVEKQETKLVFGSKKQASEEAQPHPFSLKSLLGKHQDTRTGGAAAEASAEVESDKGTEAVEWQKLFLQRDGGNAEEREFRRMRMCIVQKEETLDAIAQRYKLNPREIALHNRLSDQEVAEGQILYIPR